jgi:hypothetical protein
LSRFAEIRRDSAEEMLASGDGRHRGGAARAAEQPGPATAADGTKRLLFSAPTPPQGARYTHTVGTSTASGLGPRAARRGTRTSGTSSNSFYRILFHHRILFSGTRTCGTSSPSPTAPFTGCRPSAHLLIMTYEPARLHLLLAAELRRPLLSPVVDAAERREGRQSRCSSG